MLGEVEVKVKIGDREGMEERIRAIGGTFVAQVSQEDIYFGHPCRDLKARDEALRLRRESADGGGAIIDVLTFKGRKLGTGAKMREEIEVQVKGSSDMSALLERLGFSEVIRVRKVRRIYRLGDAEVVVDSVAGLGDFVEIEARATLIPEGSGEGWCGLEDAKAKIFKISDRLGLARKLLSSASYLELLDSANSSSRAER